MKPKLVVIVLAAGIALGAIAFAIIRPDRGAQPGVAGQSPANVRPPATAATGPAAAGMRDATNAPPPLPSAISGPVQGVQPIPPPRKVAQAMPPPGADVAIVDGKTLDFSPGAPIVRDSDKDKLAIDAALREIEAATQGMTLPAPEAVRAR